MAGTSTVAPTITIAASSMPTSRRRVTAAPRWALARLGLPAPPRARAKIRSSLWRGRTSAAWRRLPCRPRGRGDGRARRCSGGRNRCLSLGLRKERPGAREPVSNETADRIGELPDLPLRRRRRPQRKEREPAPQVAGGPHARVAPDGDDNARELFGQTDAKPLLIQRLGARVERLEIREPRLCSFVGQLLGAGDRPGLLRQMAAAELAALEGRDVVDVRQRRVARRKLVVSKWHTMPVPLPEDEDRRLHLDGEAGHLERGRVLVLPEVTEQLLVT